MTAQRGYCAPIIPHDGDWGRYYSGLVAAFMRRYMHVLLAVNVGAAGPGIVVCLALVLFRVDGRALAVVWEVFGPFFL